MKIVTSCKSGPCPTLYQDEDGKFYIQGFKVLENLKKSVSMSENEDLVEISPNPIDAIKAF